MMRSQTLFQAAVATVALVGVLAGTAAARADQGMMKSVLFGANPTLAWQDQSYTVVTLEELASVAGPQTTYADNAAINGLRVITVGVVVPVELWYTVDETCQAFTGAFAPAFCTRERFFQHILVSSKMFTAPFSRSMFIGNAFMPPVRSFDLAGYVESNGCTGQGSTCVSIVIGHIAMGQDIPDGLDQLRDTYTTYTLVPETVILVRKGALFEAEEEDIEAVARLALSFGLTALTKGAVR